MLTNGHLHLRHKLRHPLPQRLALLRKLINLTRIRSRAGILMGWVRLCDVLLLRKRDDLMVLSIALGEFGIFGLLYAVRRRKLLYFRFV